VGVTVYLVLLAVTAILGFLAGFLTFRRSLQWCKACGWTLECPVCYPRAAGFQPARSRP
jgi:hypothetical protein